jgi:malate dehydrogenase
VPVKLGREGVRQIIELSLTAEESAALEKSAASVQDLVDAMARLGAESVAGA